VKTAIVTLARGRARHLERQALAVAAMTAPPDDYVVVSLDPTPPEVPRARVLHLPVDDGEPLPLARARNLGIAEAEADLVACLDVDCLPEPQMLAAYRAAEDRYSGRLLAGPVGRLKPFGGDAPTPRQLEASRAAAREGPRPVPRDGTTRHESRYELFWSLSFALTKETHERIGGFDEAYVGYGGEDTDYALRAKRAGVRLAWVGGAWAHHQHHEISSPPVEHLDDIVANAERFHARWGVWPMEGWLRAFAEQGLIEWSPSEPAIRYAGRAQRPGSRDE
jgi:N-acetylglucosaminyl-diphospho-decaprenol L-rhamnosyltransferase